MAACNATLVNFTSGFKDSNCTRTNTAVLVGDVGFYPNVEVAGWILLVLGVGTVVSNGIFLLAYWKNSGSSLRTPFNIYLMNLAVSDFVIAIFTTPGNFALFALNRWPFGRASCTIYLYVYWNWYSVSIHYHMLISLNRLWAVWFPIHYRTFHTKRLAVLVCFATCIYTHVWTLIGLIPDALYHRTENLRDCSVNVEPQSLWVALYLFILYAVPEGVIIAVYPAIGWKVAQLRKVKTRNTKRNTVLVPGIPTGEFAKQGRSLAENRLSGSRTFQFKVLTYLVAATVVFWTPNVVFFALASTINFADFTYYTSTVVLLALNPLTTPLSYPLASTEWRKAFKSLIAR